MGKTPGWDSAVVAAGSMLLRENATVLQNKSYFDSARQIADTAATNPEKELKVSIWKKVPQTNQTTALTQNQPGSNYRTKLPNPLDEKRLLPQTKSRNQQASRPENTKH